ncbi:thioredoxin domain-containing protein 11 [Ischnura elegans]|uniref:thioredoxin domain-containing protein 11 n=1 Tax=Ischnura elegans TaxID=197161 RepID=UPI001ED86D94|nr:thioredoxin domain-containing protein 11 [Ischnura elegans]
MSLTDDEERNEDNIDTKSSNSGTSVQTSNKMYTFGREFCFILALAITSYAALQKVIPKVSMSSPASPFFHETSLVADFYRGQLGPALSRVVRSDVSFVMFYAPWDAESQLVRQEFDAAAKYYHREVYFAAVNCWQPESECRRQFPKVHQFPVFIVYGLMRGLKGLEYRGPRTMPYMVHFLKSVLHPFTRIEYPAEVTKLMTKYDAVAVGFFDMHGSSRNIGFSAFHSASVKHLETHPFGNVRFAVVTNPAAMSRFDVPGANRSQLGYPLVKLYLWNETLEYPGTSFNEDSLIDWIDKHLHAVAIWVSPPGVKSHTLSHFVDKGPVLFLFTPRNPFREDNPNFNVLREVALEYYNCNSNSKVNELIQEILSSREESRRKYEKTVKKCTPWIKKKLETLSLYHDFKESGNMLHHVCSFRNESCFCDKDGVKESCKQQTAHLWGESFPDILYGACCRDNQNPCVRPKERVMSGPNFHDDEQIFLWPFYQSSSEALWYDERVSLIQHHEKEEACKRLLHGEILHPAVFPDDNASENVSKIPENLLPLVRGLACRTNKTLSILALDSLKYHHFALGLGVDVLSKKDATAVVILHASGETQHVMTGSFSKKSLIELISNYSSGALRRSLRSESVPANEDTSHKNGQKGSTCPPNSICVLDLSSRTFKEVVLDDSKNVVVLYHSPSCAFCSSVWHIFLTVARIFTTNTSGKEVSNSSIIFARIDGDANDLPWEYTMESFPSILFFPAYRKSDSRIFPPNLPMTVSNIAQFVAANLSPEARIETLLGGCDEMCIRRAKVKCLGMIASLMSKRETTETRIKHLLDNEEGIGLSKEDLRSFKRVLFLQHRRISLRLRHVRETYLALNSRRNSQVSDTSRNVPDIEVIVSSLHRYHRALSVVSADLIEKRGQEAVNESVKSGKTVGIGNDVASDFLSGELQRPVESSKDASVTFKEEL